MRGNIAKSVVHKKGMQCDKKSPEKRTMEKKFNVIEEDTQITVQDKEGYYKSTVPKHIRQSGSSAGHTRQSFEIFGLYGNVNLKYGSYLICISEARKAGKICGVPVYEIKGIRLVKYRDNDVQESCSYFQHAINMLAGDNDESYEPLLLDNFFSLPGSYFSDYPIHESKFNRATTSFIFNKTLLDSLEKMGCGLEVFGLRSVHGYFESQKLDGLDLALISRRSRHRAGVRFFSRGADDDGYVSNFVETTQYVAKEGTELSYVQLRGSIPLKWRHKVDFRYNPTYTIDSRADILDITHKKLVETYKEIFYLNLARNDRYEKEICLTYLLELERKNKEFLHFNFEGEQLGTRGDAMKRFEHSIEGVVERHLSFSGVQPGVIRANCIDTLDRTNVGQFIIGRIALRSQLRVLGVAPSEHIESVFKKIWYGNGNTLSIQYSGTPSIKSQIVLSGGYSKTGLLRDFIFSCKRYVINRFSHGSMQNSYTMITRKAAEVEDRRGELMRSNVRLFLLVFVCVAFFRFTTGTHENAFEAAVEMSISIGFVLYLVYSASDLMNRPFKTKLE